MASSLLALACPFALSACSTSDGPRIGQAETSATDEAAREALRALAAAPGPVIATVPAVSRLPDVARWEIHRAPAGLTYAGIGAANDVRVTFLVSIPQPPDGAAPSAGLQMAGETYSVDDTLAALTGDLQAASPTNGVGTASRGVGPLALVSRGAQLLCAARDQLVFRLIQLTAKIQSLDVQPEDGAGAMRAVGQCLVFFGFI